MAVAVVTAALRSLRQLEAVIRIAEALAKMRLQAVAGEEEVEEALRLFQVSTLDAALSGSLSGTGRTPPPPAHTPSRLTR